MFCNKCGKEIPDGSIYCNHCGNKIDEPVKKDNMKILFVVYVLYLIALTLYLYDVAWYPVISDMGWDSEFNYIYFCSRIIAAGFVMPGLLFLAYKIYKKK